MAWGHLAADVCEISEVLGDLLREKQRCSVNGVHLLLSITKYIGKTIFTPVEQRGSAGVFCKM